MAAEAMAASVMHLRGAAFGNTGVRKPASKKQPGLKT